MEYFVLIWILEYLDTKDEQVSDFFEYLGLELS